jgi:hypothetical protein
VSRKIAIIIISVRLPLYSNNVFFSLRFVRVLNRIVIDIILIAFSLLEQKQVFFFGNTQIQALLALLLVVLYIVMHVFAKVRTVVPFTWYSRSSIAHSFK